MLATWVKTHYTKSESNNCFIIHSKYFPPQNMLNKKRYRITETSNEDKIDGRFGFTFKVKKCQVDKLHIFIYVNLSNWYFLVLNIASLKMTSKRRSNLSEILFTCFSIRKTCLTLCKNFFFKTYVIVWLFHLRPTYKIFSLAGWLIGHKKNALYYCAQSANSISRVLFVNSYTSAYLATGSRFVHKAFLTWNEGNTVES